MCGSRSYGIAGKRHVRSGAALLVGAAAALLVGADAFSTRPETECADPLGAILATLDCIEKEDPECAASGYSKEFVKLHNGKLDPTTAGIDEPEWWTRAFFVIDIGIVSNHQSHFDTNRVSLRYIEPVKTLDMSSYTIPGLGKGPEQVEILQHEHALVTVNADCKMIEWDQYGDNTEQEQVGVAVNATLPYLPLYLACVQGPNAELC